MSLILYMLSWRCLPDTQESSSSGQLDIWVWGRRLPQGMAMGSIAPSTNSNQATPNKRHLSKNDYLLYSYSFKTSSRQTQLPPSSPLCLSDTLEQTLGNHQNTEGGWSLGS